MLDFLWGRATDRKLRLFTCAWAADVWLHLSDSRSRNAVTTAERYADGEVTHAELLAAHRDAADACHAIQLATGRHRDGINRRRTTMRRAAKVAVDVARHAADPEWDARLAARAVQWQNGSTRYALSNYLRDIFQPYQNTPLEPAWLTSTVLGLAREVYDSRDASVIPILADALQDAGCEDEPLLSHCRSECNHVRGCWVIDELLGNG